MAEKWPMVQARWYTKVGASQGRNVRGVVIHDMEFFERGDSAEVIAHDFATRDASNKGSAHICADNNSIVQCVYDSDIAYAAPGMNHDGIQIELAGYGKQTADEWRDVYSIAVLSWAAFATSYYCIKYSLPVRRLTVAQVKDGKTKGICGHVDVTNAFHKSDHTDPGENFPWDLFLGMVAQFIKDRQAA